MVIIFLATSLLLVLFQTNIHATSARSTNKTIGQLLDESFLKLEYRYQTLKDYMKKLHGSCVPCKASAKDNGVCDCTDIEPREDCLEFYQHGCKINSVYRLQGPGFHIVYAYCDQTTQGGGWTVFQKRQDGSVDFTRNWNSYKHGFGNIEGEFWFGNDNIHDLTKPSFAPKKSQLLINMRMKGQSDPVFVKYYTFEITNKTSKYTLKINGFSGNVTDRPRGMDYNNNQKFSTFDSDNSSSGKCAVRFGNNGWWYGSGCSHVILNGRYKFTQTNGELFWNYSLIQPEFVEIKMRRNL